ncbi:3'-5' exoribonuclease domain-containing protein [Nocardia sp. NPDC006044]|uniref:3'-5' exoribonuclease domain-containing protein n=1 Tax=Nocardia sp. NPDC006044 TaxID=3364306 RepID=UPI00368960AF
MKYWYDTEFLENGATIELISIGIVAEDGREYYAVNADAPWDRIAQHPWLTCNVVPHLGDHRTPRHLIRTQIEHFLRPAEPGDAVPELWGWKAAYDHIVLAQLFGAMLDFPHWMPQWTNDVRQEQRRLGDPELPEQLAGLHHALHDARHTRLRHQTLIALADADSR